jgi:hypothetical protein
LERKNTTDIIGTGRSGGSDFGERGADSWAEFG